MKKFILSVSIISIFLFGCKSSELSSNNDKPPNFLFVIVDDQSAFDLNAYNSSSILETPNIDRWVAEGVVIESARHMSSWLGAVCTTSRHMVMSGRTLWHLPAQRGFQNPNPPENLEQQTIGAVFNRVGNFL